MGEMIRWGIWGTGAIAHQLVSDFPLVQGAALQAVASRNGEHARAFASHYGVRKSYAGLETLLKDKEVDVVYIATPNHCHMDDSLACMAAGKAVLCEKPFALNQAQARRMADAAKQHKVFCMEAMWTRFIPAVIEAKRMIEARVIGPVRLIQGNFAYPVAPGASGNLFDSEKGGGALLDRGVYLISLSQYLFGAARSIRGTAVRGSSGVDEQSAYQLTYGNGELAAFSASLRTRGTNEVVIGGELGRLRLCEPFYRSHSIVAQPFPPPPETVATAPPAGMRNSPVLKGLQRKLGPLLEVLQRGRVQTFTFPGNGYQFELRHVTDCVKEGRLESPIMPLSDSLEVMRTLDVLHAEMRTI